MNFEEKQITLRALTTGDITSYYDKSMTQESMYDMLRYRMRFGEAEARVIIAALVISGAKFEEK